MANAKNSYGGYVGLKLIKAIEGKGIIRASFDDPLSAYVEHAGRKWLPPPGYWSCAETLDESVVAAAVKRFNKGVSARD
jgi:hypothetical protein